MSLVFVAGGTGYIGSRFVEAALNAGLALCVLTRSRNTANQLNSRNVKTVIGDLSEPGPWQKEAAAADLAMFIAAPPTWGKKVTKQVANDYRKGLSEITQSFFESLDPHQVQKIVYVAGSSYYGDTGITLASESKTPTPTGWGPYLAPAVKKVEEFIQAGYPTVLAFPGMVYGPGSWYDQLILRPLHRKKNIYGLRHHEPIISPIHVEDCGRALLHLLPHGESGERYFIADDQPMTMKQLIHYSSEIAEIRSKELDLPAWLCRMVLGPVVTEYAMANTSLSNQKLKNLGFEFRYPTVQTGLAPVIAEWRQQHHFV